MRTARGLPDRRFGLHLPRLAFDAARSCRCRRPTDPGAVRLRAIPERSDGARRPHYVAVAFDESHGSCFRNELYPAYKANREPAPPAADCGSSRCAANSAGTWAWPNSPTRLRGRRSDRHAGGAVPRRGTAGDGGVARQGSGAADRARGCVLGLQRVRPNIATSRSRRASACRPSAWPTTWRCAATASTTCPACPGVGAKTAAALMNTVCLAR